jgi:hypothetical protein
MPFRFEVLRSEQAEFIASAPLLRARSEPDSSILSRVAFPRLVLRPVISDLSLISPVPNFDCDLSLISTARFIDLTRDI